MTGTVDQFTTACAEALFTSDLSARRRHSRAEIEAAIRRAVANHRGVRGCTAEVAAAYGDDPEAAVRRMCWARAVAERIGDPEVLGLNGVSDGKYVVLPAQVTGLAARLAAAGFTPVGVNLSELLKAGGGPKCCTLELRRLSLARTGQVPIGCQTVLVSR